MSMCYECGKSDMLTDPNELCEKCVNKLDRRELLNELEAAKEENAALKADNARMQPVFDAAVAHSRAHYAWSPFVVSAQQRVTVADANLDAAIRKLDR